MNTYIAVKNRLLELCGEKHLSIHKLAMESAVPPSTIKKLCDGLNISIEDFFCSDLFRNLEQEIK